MNKRLIVALALTAMLIGWSPLFTGDSRTIASAQLNRQSSARRLALPGRVIVKYHDDAAAQDAEAFVAMHHKTRRLNSSRLQVIDIPTDINAAAYARLLTQMPGVEFAEPDYLLLPAGIPDDPLYAYEWHLATINAPAAWNVTTGSAAIILAVCDTGIDATHPDLAGQMVPGWNVIDNNADTSPVNPHGTWVAGTAAAATNNGVGVAALAMGCRIMPVRVTSRSDGAAAISDIVAATIWAADHGARVINVSYAGYNSAAISDAAQYARSKNAVFVMAAGNDARSFGNPDDPNILAVSATTSTDELASFTSTGSYVDLAAPGQSILTTGLLGAYESVSGTSFSAPLVAGTVALMFSAYPQLSVAQAEALLKVSTDDRGQAGYDTGYGFGRLNAGRALELTQAKLYGAADLTPPALRFLQPYGDGLVGQMAGEVVRIEAVDDRQVAKVTLYADDQMIGQATAAPFTFTWNTSKLPNGSQHVLRAVARDKANNQASLQLPVVVQSGYDVTPPVIEITSPADGSQIKTNGGNQSLRVSVNASDNSGKLLSVELYLDGVLATSSVSSPYTMYLPVDQLAPGPHTLVCVAYDQSFNTARSNAVTVIR